MTDPNVIIKPAYAAATGRAASIAHEDDGKEFRNVLSAHFAASPKENLNPPPPPQPPAVSNAGLQRPQPSPIPRSVSREDDIKPTASGRTHASSGTQAIKAIIPGRTAGELDCTFLACPAGGGHFSDVTIVDTRGKELKNVQIRPILLYQSTLLCSQICPILLYQSTASFHSNSSHFTVPIDPFYSNN